MQSETLGRRSWLRAAIGVIGAAIASILGVVVGGAIVSPGLAGKGAGRWVPAGKRVDDLDAGVPLPITLRVTREDGYYEAVDLQSMFLVKGDDGRVRVLSSTCTHLGCHVSYDADAKLIKCPCHGGVFAPDGRNIGGPPPRPLQEIAARVEDGRVLVQL